MFWLLARAYIAKIFASVIKVLYNILFLSKSSFKQGSPTSGGLAGDKMADFLEKAKILGGIPEC